jgi:hypothetical protein
MTLVALDVAIGLIFVYLLLSLVVLAINEGFATLVNFRARTMVGGIQTLLGGSVGGADVRMFVRRVYGHPLIDALHERRQIWGTGHKAPAYIPSATFVSALLDEITTSANNVRRAVGLPRLSSHWVDMETLRGAIAMSSLPSSSRHQLRVIVDEAGDDPARARIGMERWFEDGMARVSAVYKARIHSIGIIVAFVVSVAAHADSIAIARALAGNATLRAATVTRAQNLAQVSLDSLMRDPRGQIDALGVLAFPFGYPSIPKDQGLLEFYSREIVKNWTGFLLTGLAVSLGAPFWFDLLNKVVTIRGAGRAPEEKAKSPKGAPPPRGNV